MSFNEVKRVTAELDQLAGSFSDTLYADAPLGAILPYGGDAAPVSWLLCNGAAVNRTTYADLFAVIGTKYGPGDGNTTFNLPDAESGAALYPTGDGDGLELSNYIIKARKTAMPSEFQEEIDLKQNITDNTLETTSKTIPGAINELNSKTGWTLVGSKTGGGGSQAIAIPSGATEILVKAEQNNSSHFFDTAVILVDTLTNTDQNLCMGGTWHTNTTDYYGAGFRLVCQKAFVYLAESWSNYTKENLTTNTTVTLYYR